jgi:hypothetical protein
MTLVVGSSQVKYFHHYVPSTYVTLSFSGYCIEDICDEVVDIIPSFETVVLHVGTNNTPKDDGPAMCRKLQQLEHRIRQLKPEIDIIYSGVLPRDISLWENAKNNRTFLTRCNERALWANRRIASVASRKERFHYVPHCSFVKQGKIQRQFLARDGLHLSPSGAKVVVSDIVRKVIEVQRHRSPPLVQQLVAVRPSPVAPPEVAVRQSPVAPPEVAVRQSPVALPEVAVHQSPVAPPEVAVRQSPVTPPEVAVRQSPVAPPEVAVSSSSISSSSSSISSSSLANVVGSVCVHSEAPSEVLKFDQESSKHRSSCQTRSSKSTAHKKKHQKTRSSKKQTCQKGGGVSDLPIVYSSKMGDLHKNEILEYLNNPDYARTTSVPPIKPMSGEIYLFSSRDNVAIQNDWKADSYRWRDNGQTVLKLHVSDSTVCVKKKHYCIIGKDKTCDKRFRLHNYALIIIAIIIACWYVIISIYFALL